MTLATETASPTAPAQPVSVPMARAVGWNPAPYDSGTRFSHVKPGDSAYLPGGLRDFFLYRDLGVKDATNGRVIAHLEIVGPADFGSIPAVARVGALVPPSTPW